MLKGYLSFSCSKTRAARMLLAASVIIMSFTVESSDLLLRSGDTISVSIYGEPELKLMDYRIPSTGKAKFQLVGELEVVGKTAKELEVLLIEAYKDGYLLDPQITVEVTAFRPVFVNGQVARPGSYGYVDGLTARKAIALAGGLTERASLRKITLVRSGSSDVLSVDDELDATQMKPGDILTIGESMF